MRSVKAIFFLFVVILIAEICSPTHSNAAPTEVIRPHGNEFILNGKAFRFIGVNIRGLAHYGKGDVLPYTNASHIDENLNGLQSMGGKVVRLFAPVRFASHQENVNRLKNVLDKMEPKGIKAIVCLTDLYTSSFNPQGDDGYYMVQPNGWDLLDDSWFKTGYKINYKPFVQLAVNQLKDHNAIFAWELGNELTDIKDPNAIIAFTSDMAATIKNIDPYHMVTTGFISVDHIQIGETAGYQLYADPNIDFITVHSYNGDDPNANRAVHSRLGKPLLLEEYGWDSSHGSRITNTQTQVNKWFDTRCSRGFMQWGFQAQSYDIGDGDNSVGMDRYAHPDYNELFSIYSTRATQIANNPITLQTRLAPDGTNVARFATAWQTDSNYSSSYGGDKAYDGIISAVSKWTSLGTTPPHWIAINLGLARDVNGITLRMAGAANEYVSFNFESFLVQSGISMSGPWTTEFNVSNPAQFSFYHCLYDTSKSLQYIRIYITDSGIDDYARLPELEVYETPSSVINCWNLY